MAANRIGRRSRGLRAARPRNCSLQWKREQGRSLLLRCKGRWEKKKYDIATRGAGAKARDSCFTRWPDCC